MTKTYSYNKQKTKWEMSKIYFENRYNKPKKSFIDVKNIILKKFKKKKLKLLDVGSADSSFCYYLSNNKSIEVTNLEYDKSLVNYSKKKFPDFKIIQGDINNCKKIKRESFDVITCIGVISIFDDFRPSVNEMLRMVKKNGLIIISNMWNSFPIDLNIKIRRSEGKKPFNNTKWESGWNMISVNTMTKFLKFNKKVKKFKFINFFMDIELPKNEKNLMRAWTIKNNKGRKTHFNGIGREIDKKILVIDLK